MTIAEEVKGITNEYLKRQEEENKIRYSFEYRYSELLKYIKKQAEKGEYSITIRLKESPDIEEQLIKDGFTITPRIGNEPLITWDRQMTNDK